MFAFDEFDPLGIRPTAGSGWAAAEATWSKHHRVTAPRLTGDSHNCAPR
uniref:Uncharacterized protein n=1 Tax=Streptomyces sp. NBC_00093 TaxID=2975649 RepID=A0AAU2A4L1_9ACTN